MHLKARHAQFNGKPNIFYLLIIGVEGNRGAGARENRGREGYGRREEKGLEAVFPKWREPGEKEKNFAILRNILQWK